jgi:hypothetical protein
MFYYQSISPPYPLAQDLLKNPDTAADSFQKLIFIVYIYLI